MNKLSASMMIVLGMWFQVFTSDVMVLREDYQVIQRDANDNGAFIIEVPDGLMNDKFLVRIISETGAIKVNKEIIAGAYEGVKKGILVENVPVGGPYIVEMSSPGSSNRIRFERILVGDIWLLGGQSNMYGSVPIEEPLGALPYLNMVDFELLHSDVHWCAAIPPIHRYPKENNKDVMLKRQYPSATGAEIQKMIDSNVPAGGIGPGYFFACELYKETGVPIGLLPFAFGAALAEWDPNKKEQNRYGFMYANTKKYVGRVKGMLWCQGEQEAIFGDDVKIVTKPSLIYPVSTYGKEFKKFVETMRKDFKSPDMVVIVDQLYGQYAPFYYAFEGYDDQHVEQKKLSSNMRGGIGWEKMREIQRLLPQEINNVHVIPTLDLNLADGLHLDYNSYKIVEHRMAYVAAPHVNKDLQHRTEIKLKSAKWLNVSPSGNDLETRLYQRKTGTGPFSGGAHIAVEFEGVSGKLNARGAKLTGFSLKNKQTGRIEDWIFRIDFDDARPNVVVLSVMAAVPKDQVVLYYGAGAAPYVNIVDENGMGLPAFGPLEIGN